ncbi:MAG: zinc-dependent metalloprotease family protein, partial [SAR324 cluster bacterium]
ILSASSTPNLYDASSGNIGTAGYANVLVPQSPSFSAKAGTWTFKAYTNDRVSIALRTGSTPSAATITIQPYITGTTWSAGDISVALSVMSGIYSANGITLTINDTITISDTQYAAVSETFTNSTTSALVSQGVTESVNLFFIKDYSDSENLGNAAGIPGSMGIANSWNGVLNSLSAHASGTTLDSQLLGETAAHEMGHQLGLFHTTESGGTVFDILTDTAECLNSTKDFDRNGKMSAEECEGYGGENLMFWTAWNTSSRSAGKKQETLSSHQQHVLKYSPLAK